MKMRRLAALLTLAAVSLGISGRAMASYSYVATPLITSINGVNVAATNTATVGGTTITFFPVSRTAFDVPSTNTLNIGDINVTTTTLQPAGDTFTIGYTDLFTLTNTPPPGFAQSGPFALTGTLTLNNISTLSGTVSNVYNAPTSAQGVLGGVTFTGSVNNFAGPTVGGSNGNFGGIISAVSVPEPGSILMLGLGLGGVGLVGLRQRKTQV